MLTAALAIAATPALQPLDLRLRGLGCELGVVLLGPGGPERLAAALLLLSALGATPVKADVFRGSGGEYLSTIAVELAGGRVELSILE